MANPIINTVSNILQSKVTQKAVQKASSEWADNCTSFFVSKLSPKACYHQYKPETQQKILDFLPTITEIQSTFLRNLSEYNTDEQNIIALLKNTKLFNKYCNIKNALFQVLKNVNFNNKKEREILLENMSMLILKDGQSFANLYTSKGFKAILDGSLSPKYIQELTADTKIGYNHFYEFFDDLERVTAKNLDKIPTLDKSKVFSLINSMDEEICKDPQVLVELLSSLKKHPDPEIINDLLEICSKDISNGNYYTAKQLIKLTSENPQAYLKLKALYKDRTISIPHFLSRDMEALTSADCKIDDELFETMIRNRKKYENCDLFEIDNFLKTEGADKKLLNDYIDAINKANENERTGHSIRNINKNNIEYLRHLLQEQKLDKHSATKLIIMEEVEMFKEPQNWHLIDEIYENTYLPWMKALDDQDKAITLSIKRLIEPENYKSMEDSGIFDLVKQKKINTNVIYKEASDVFRQDLLDDIQRLRNGESLVKHFSSLEEATAKSAVGDAISINGKMFINDSGKLEPWNMSEESFNKLFPLVQRFSCTQGLGDCFLISALENLYSNPHARGKYYKLFEQQGDDIVVTLPAYKDFNGSVRFAKGELEKSCGSANGARHMQLVEQTYARTALRAEKFTPTTQNPLKTDDIDFLNKRIDGGQTSDAIRDLLGIDDSLISPKISTIIVKNDNKEEIKELIEKNINDEHIIINLGYCTNNARTTGHAISIKGYNPQKGKITICDPNNTAYLREVSLEEQLATINRIWITKV